MSLHLGIGLSPPKKGSEDGALQVEVFNAHFMVMVFVFYRICNLSASCTKWNGR